MPMFCLHRWWQHVSDKTLTIGLGEFLFPACGGSLRGWLHCDGPRLGPKGVTNCPTITSLDQEAKFQFIICEKETVTIINVCKCIMHLHTCILSHFYCLHLYTFQLCFFHDVFGHKITYRGTVAPRGPATKSHHATHPRRLRCHAPQ